MRKTASIWSAALLALSFSFTQGAMAGDGSANNQGGIAPERSADATRAASSEMAPGTRVVALNDLGCGVYAGTEGTYWGLNGYNPPAYVVWDSGGGCAAAIPDTAPFSSSSSEHTDYAYWVWWEDIDVVSTSPTTSTGGSDACRATFSPSTGVLDIPCLDVPGPFGTTAQAYTVQLQLAPGLGYSFDLISASPTD